MTAAAVVELIFPGLLMPWPQAGQPGFPAPQAAALTRLLSRARVEDGDVGSAQALLARRFALPGEDAPFAALSALGEGLPEVARDYWLRVDPVHLRADRQRVLLFGGDFLELTPAESAELVALINRHFVAQGIELIAPSPMRWYLRLPEDPQARFFPMERVLGADIGAALPQGEAGGYWRSWMNEVQMLLHECAVNQTREARGQSSVSGVWPWGLGRLPSCEAGDVGRIVGGGTTARGLAARLRIDHEPLPQASDDWLVGLRGHNLIVINDPGWASWQGDPFAWAAAVEDWERRWFSALETALGAGRLGLLVFHAGNGRRYRIARADLRRFWRRRRTLTDFG